MRSLPADPEAGGSGRRAACMMSQTRVAARRVRAGCSWAVVGRRDQKLLAKHRQPGRHRVALRGLHGRGRVRTCFATSLPSSCRVLRTSVRSESEYRNGIWAGEQAKGPCPVCGLASQRVRIIVREITVQKRCSPVGVCDAGSIGSAI